MRHPVGSNILNQRRKTAALADMQTNQQAVAGPGKNRRKREETYDLLRCLTMVLIVLHNASLTIGVVVNILRLH